MPATHPPAEHRSRQHSQGAAFAAAFARLIAVEGGYVNDGCEDIAWRSVAVAEELFEAGVNCGVTRVAMWLQRTLNALNDSASRWPDLMMDGRVGPVTLAALFQSLARSGGEQVILAALNSLQGEHYIALAERRPKDERFVWGWLAHRVQVPR